MMRFGEFRLKDLLRGISSWIAGSYWDKTALRAFCSPMTLRDGIYIVFAIIME
jgi:hypothetical protein